MARLRALMEAGVQTLVRGNSVWVGYPGIKIRAGNGEMTVAGMEYENMMSHAGLRAETRVFHHASVPTMVHAVERVRDRAGNMRVLRQWDPSLNDGHGAWRFTDAGQRYHGRVRFDIEVPVWVHKVNPRTGIETAYSEWDGRPAYLPMTDDYLVGHHALPGDMGVVRDVNTLHAQSHFIEEALKKHFRTELQDPAKVEHDTGRLLSLIHI